MVIPLKNLKDGVHEFRGTSSAGRLGIDEDVFAGDIFTDITVDKRGFNYHIVIESRSAGTFCCDRCLEQFEMEIKNKSRILYTGDKSLVDTMSKEKEDVRFIKPDDIEIDFSDDIKQFLLLEIPYKKVCKEECKGLCAKCGQNLNLGQCDCEDEYIDPRWENLKGLK